MAEDIGTLRGIIELDDKFSKEIERVNKEMEELKKSSDSTGISLDKFKAPAIAVGGALAAVGAAAAASVISLVSLGGETTDLAARFGASTDALQEWEFAGKLVGVSGSEIAIGMKKLQTSLGEGSKETTEKLQKLGLNIKDLRAMDPGKMFEEILGKVAQLEDPIARTAMATEFLGRSGAALIPLGANLEQIKQRAHDLGVIMDKDTIAAADDLGDSFDTLMMVAQGLGNNFASAVVTSEPLHVFMEQMIQVVGDLSVWVKSNEDTLRGWVNDGVLLMASSMVGAIDVIEYFAAGFKALMDVWANVRAAGEMLIATLKLQFEMMTTPWNASEHWEEYKQSLMDAAATATDSMKENSDALAGFTGFAEKAKDRAQQIANAVAAADGKVRGLSATLQGHNKISLESAKAAEEAAKAFVALSEAADKEEQALADADTAMLNLAGPTINKTVEEFSKLSQSFQEQLTRGELLDDTLKSFIESYEGLDPAVKKALGGQEAYNQALVEADNRGVLAGKALKDYEENLKKLPAPIDLAAERLKHLTDVQEDFAALGEAIGIVGETLAAFGLDADTAMGQFVDAAQVGVEAASSLTTAFMTGDPIALVQGIGQAWTALTGVWDAFTGSAKRAAAELKHVREEIIDSLGGFEELAARASEAGIALDDLNDAQNRQEAKEAGSRINLELEAYDKRQLALENYVKTTISGAQLIADGFSKIDRSLMGDDSFALMGRDSAQMFGAGFSNAMDQLGVLGAIDQMGDQLVALYEKMGAEGARNGAAILEPFVQLRNVLADDTHARGMLEILTGMGDVLESGLGAGFADPEAFQAVQNQLQETNKALIEAGAGPEAAMRALMPELTTLIQASEAAGIPLDTGTQQLKDAAEAMGFSFPVEPMQQMVDLLSALVQGMGFALPESIAATKSGMDTLNAAADESFGKVLETTTATAEAASAIWDQQTAKLMEDTGAFSEAAIADFQEFGDVAIQTGDWVGVSWGGNIGEIGMMVAAQVEPTETGFLQMQEAALGPIEAISGALNKVNGGLSGIISKAPLAGDALGNMPSPNVGVPGGPSVEPIYAAEGLYVRSMPHGPLSGGGTPIVAHPDEEVDIRPAGSARGGGGPSIRQTIHQTFYGAGNQREILDTVNKALTNNQAGLRGTLERYGRRRGSR